MTARSRAFRACKNLGETRQSRWVNEPKCVWRGIPPKPTLVKIDHKTGDSANSDSRFWFFVKIWYRNVKKIDGLHSCVTKYEEIRKNQHFHQKWWSRFWNDSCGPILHQIGKRPSQFFLELSGDSEKYKLQWNWDIRFEQLLSSQGRALQKVALKYLVKI